MLDTADTSEREIASLMVGRDVIFDDLRTEQRAGKPMLEIYNLKALSDRGLPALNGVTLHVSAGEIVGVCGVEGNGQTELAECIAGMRGVRSGSISLCGREVTGETPRTVRENGLSYIPEDRLAMGMDAKASIAENLLLGRQRTREFSLFGIHLKKRKISRHAREMIKTYDIRTSGEDEPAGALSGGNMQKVIIAREFEFEAPVLLVCQPTRGVDIGAAEFIHEQIIQKRNEGCAVLLISADLDELFRLSDRMITLYDGRITGEFKAGTIDKQAIGYFMTGGYQEVSAE